MIFRIKILKFEIKWHVIIGTARIKVDYLLFDKLYPMMLRSSLHM